MKKLALCFLSLAAVSLASNIAVAQRDGEGDRPRVGQRDGDRGRGPRDGDREGGRRGDGERGRDGDRGPRDGDRREGDRPRDGERPPREGDRPRDGERPPREGGDRGPRGPILDALDRNRNGVLESDEIDQAIVVLRRLDRNRDGKISPDELGGRGSGQEGRPQGDRPPREGEGGRGQGRPSPEQMMARFNESDKNDDGKLSKDEAPEPMRRGFDRIDTNGDGFVEKSEFEEMIRRFQQGGRGDRPREGEGRGREGREGDRPREGDGERKRPEIE